MSKLTPDEVSLHCRLAYRLYRDTSLRRKIQRLTKSKFDAYQQALDGGDPDTIIKAELDLIRAELAAGKEALENESQG